MLSSMSAAEASAHSLFLLEEDATERLWQVWLTGAAEGKSFAEYKAEQQAASNKTTPERARVRALRPGEEADRLAFAAQFVKFDHEEAPANG